jgi:glycine/D-amino acid oxidase-like deaminating enzyme
MARGTPVYEVMEKEGIMGRRVVIIGGGAAGPSTAAEAKRRDPSLGITIIESGAYVSYAS